MCVCVCCKMSAEVITISRPPFTEPSLVLVNVIIFATHGVIIIH